MSAKGDVSYRAVIVLSLLLAVVQMAAGHWLGLHDGLEHMQYGSNYWLYGLEVVLNWVFWLILGVLLVNQRLDAERKQAFFREKGKARLEAMDEYERDHQVMLRNGFVWAEQNMSLRQTDW